MSGIFKFKQFEVDQRNCAMKINTDGVLLGATADHPAPSRMLDIGTGTGVIALMLAQRFPDAFVDAVEIDSGAAETAKENFNRSPFAHRLNLFLTSFELFDASSGYDMIVSNPPFFVNDLKSDDERKMLARHTSVDFFDMLLERSSVILNADGLFWLILPPVQAELSINNAPQYGLSLINEIDIRSFKNKAVFRKLLCLGKMPGTFKRTDFVLYDAPGVHSQHYNQLLHDFLLAL